MPKEWASNDPGYLGGLIVQVLLSLQRGWNDACDLQVESFWRRELMLDASIVH